jgi:hypothetical protein
MNVLELIAALEKLPDTAEVWLSIDHLEARDFDISQDGPEYVVFEGLSVSE